MPRALSARVARRERASTAAAASAGDRPATANAQSRPLGLGFALILAAAAGGMLATFFGFDAEDAYIVLRYGYNWANHGAFVYNVGEPISALTSPLHAVLVALLHSVVDRVQLGNKIFGIACLCGALLLLLRPWRRQQAAAAAVAVLVAISPYVLIWTVAGLETPLLSLLVTALTVVAYRHRAEAKLSMGTGLALSALSGLIFLTRFDSVLFQAPILVWCARRLPVRRAALCSLPGLGIVLPWLAFSQFYFGDILPTSFYVKTPGLDLRWMAGNGLYLADFYVVSGLLVMHLALVALVALQRDGWCIIGRPHLREMWWGYGGLGLVAAYGLLTARTHMMFSFRLVVPYLPVAALLVADLVTRVVRHGAPPAGVRRALRTAIAVVFSMQLINFLGVRFQNVGGSRTGEFRGTSSAEMERILQIFETSGDAIRDHWQAQAASGERRPRIQTHAAGIVPYRVAEADAYDALTAYRHRCRLPADELRQQSDYIVTFYPSPTESADELRDLQERYEVVYQGIAPLDSVQRQWLVFFNVAPEPFVLPARIDEPCREPGRS